MAQFRDNHASYEHSRGVFDLINQYDAFLDGLKVIVDMGAGNGRDIEWWATLMDKDDPPKPRNYTCFAVDRNTGLVDKQIAELKNVTLIQADFEKPRVVPRKIDLLWSHNSFQYAVNPLQTLSNWNEMMNVNGMLLITVPQTQSYQYNRLVTRTYNNAFYSYNPINLMYMLAVNGFDCKDCYVYKEANDPWMTIAVYKSDIAPMDPATTTWDTLAQKGLIHESIMQSYTKHGHVQQEDLLFKWLNGNWMFIKD